MVEAEHGRCHYLYYPKPKDAFTENETNTEKLFGTKTFYFVKDAFHDGIIENKIQSPPQKKMEPNSRRFINMPLPVANQKHSICD